MKENFIFSSTPIEVSEFANHKEATFLISVLDEYNSNGVLIEKVEGEKYHNTIIGYPIVAYLKYDKDGKPDDFGGHELRAKYNSETKKIEYYFATHPIGSVTESWIEEREVEGYEGEKSCILIKTKLWKSRFPEYFKVFDKLWETGKLASSWEISSSESEKTSKGKVLKAFEFIGNAILGSNVTGAVQGAGVLEVASEDEINFELSNAFLQDIQKSSDDDVEEDVHDKMKKEMLEDMEDEDCGECKTKGGKRKMSENNNKELSALTDNDLYSKVRKAINSSNQDKWYYISMLYPYDFRAVAYEWDRASEEDYVSFSYVVNSDDTISITAQEDVKLRFVPVSDIENQIAELKEKLTSAENEIAEAGKAVTQLTSEKETLETQISELTPFKTKVEEMEQAELNRQLAEKVEEFKTFVIEDNLISETELSEDETLQTLISELSLENFESSKEKVEVMKGRKAIQKFKEQQLAQKQDQTETEVLEEVETSSKAKTDLNNGDSDGVLTAKDIVLSMLGKK